MSMWYCLAKITPDSLAAMWTQPELVGGLFFDDCPPVPGDFDKKADTQGDDWLMLSEVAEAYAAVRGTPAEFCSQATWLSKAVNGAGGEELDFAFTYGSAWALTPDRVAEVAQGLKAETAALQAAAADTAEEEDDPTPFYFTLVRAIAEFYGAAAEQGRAIVGGVT
jgi:hypothetical protein